MLLSCGQSAPDFGLSILNYQVIAKCHHQSCHCEGLGGGLCQGREKILNKDSNLNEMLESITRIH